MKVKQRLLYAPREINNTNVILILVNFLAVGDFGVAFGMAAEVEK